MKRVGGSHYFDFRRNVLMSQYQWEHFDEIQRREALLAGAEADETRVTIGELIYRACRALEREQDRRAKRAGVDLTRPPQVLKTVEERANESAPPVDSGEFRAVPRPQTF